MLIECSLASIKEHFEKEDIDCSIEKAEGFATEFLVIDMGGDEQGRPQEIELFAVQRGIPEKEESKETQPGKPNFLQIQYIIPFEFQEKAVSDIARFLLLINKTLDFPGFGVSEVDRVIYYRHDLFCDRSKVNTEALKGLLGYLLLIVDSFSPTIEKLALQETTFVKVIEEFMGKE